MTERVVGAAIVRDGRLLAARRAAPAATAGRWELPGGKVETGESDDAALVREVEEELGVRIRVERWLPGQEPLGAGSGAPGTPGAMVLRVALATLLDGEPHPHEHDELRWLGADELDSVDWLAGDRPFVTAVARLAAQPVTGSGAGESGSS